MLKTIPWRMMARGCAVGVLAGLIVASWESDFNGHICELNQTPNDKDCPAYSIFPFLLIQVGKTLHTYEGVVTALATAVIAVFTTILGLFTMSLSRSTRLAAEAAVAADLPIVRPQEFSLVEVTSTHDRRAIRPDNIPPRMRATFGLRNVGRTAAEITSVCMDWQVCPALPPIPAYKTIMPFSPGTFIAANSILDAGPQQYFIELTSEQIRAIEERSAYLWIYGFVTYLDFLQRQDEVRFCTKYLFFHEAQGAPKGFVYDSKTPAEYTRNPNTKS